MAMQEIGRNLLALAGAALLGTPTMAQGPVPDAIKARVNELVATCANAGGTLGNMSGQGQFVIPVDLTGDGKTDFLVSAGNFPCTGKPALFRADGLGRMQIYAGDGAGGARLLFDDRLLGYRLVAGKPTKIQIARKGGACGASAAASARCGDELRWNATSQQFDAVATDGRPAAPRAIAAPQAAGAPVTAAATSAPPGGPVAAAGTVPPVLTTAQASFKTSCRQEFLADKPKDTSWIDGACADEWKRVTDAQPVVEQMLLAVPAGPGAAPALAELKQRMAGVRWGRAPQGQLAAGKVGIYDMGITGKGQPDSVNVNWMKTGATIPLNVPAAFAARGAKLTLTRCEKMGAGEGQRVWSVALPGRRPFELSVMERTAPTAGAFSIYEASVRLDGAAAGRGPTTCERFW